MIRSVLKHSKALFMSFVIVCPGLAQISAPVAGHQLANHVSAFATSGRNLGPANASEVAEVSLWLHLHNRSELDQLAADVYDVNSPRYHQWLRSADFKAKYAPTAAEVQTVREFLASKNLSVVSVDPSNLYVRARGTVGSIAKAFQVSINNYSLKGETHRANAENPFVSGPASLLVRSVSGLDDMTFKHHVVQAGAKSAGQSGMKAASTASSPSTFFDHVCFSSTPVTESYSGNGYPEATYTGLQYDPADSSGGCGYTPPEIRIAYGLQGLYKKGFDGTGQTIVISDWCGSPTIMADANAFSAEFNLPPITSSNFSIVNYPGPSTCATADSEINLDVEWAHVVAPGANILLLVPPSPTFQDTDEAEVYAEEQYGASAQGWGSIFSGSYGAEEIDIAISEVENQNLIGEIGAVFGMALNFSSGDNGDYTGDYPKFNPASVNIPADGQYVTGVGGITLALNSNYAMRFQTGWGNNITALREAGSALSPPFNLGFIYGSGGGQSAVLSKPRFQSKLSGGMRKVPDISWLADPYTGVVILISEPFTYPEQQYQTIGGTSVACPMFAGLWAIANQEAGASLGQAASYVYSMPANTIYDIVPVGSRYDVTGTVKNTATQSFFYSADALADPLNGTTTFLSAIWDYPEVASFNTNYLITFGTDSGLKTGPGWDNVTGVGVPHAEAFADYFNPAK